MPLPPFINPFKLSQIAPAGAPPALTDQLVGVTGGTTDNLYTLNQITSTVSGVIVPSLNLRSVLPVGFPGKTFYVATTGSDTTGDGSIGNPWATPQWAYNNICAFWSFEGVGSPNLPNHSPNVPGTFRIQMADGTYNSSGSSTGASGFYVGSSAPTSTGGNTVQWFGNASDPSKVIWQGPGFGGIGFWVDGGSNITNDMEIGYITFKGWNTAIKMTYQSSMYFHDCFFDVPHNSGAIDIEVYQPQVLLFYYGNMKITGNRNTHMQVRGGDLDVTFGSTITLVGTPAFGGQFVQLQGGEMNFRGANAMTFSGSATGKRFDVTENGKIISTGSKTFFPGSTPGTLSNGGVYT